MSSTVSGLLFGTAAERRLALLDAMYTCGLAAGWNVETAARLLAVAPHNRALWDFVESKPTDLASQYWQIAFPGFIGDDAEELQFVARKLLAAKRPRSALAACRFNAATMDHDLLATLLERMLAGDEMTRPLPKSWDVQQMLAHLQTDTRIEQARLIRLEFGLIPALGYEHEGAAKTLYGELLSDPAFFVELLKLVFRPATAANVAEPSEGSKATAEIAYRVLMHCKRVPGHREDGIVDEAAFSAFTEQARVLAIEADRRDVFDSKFGEILAYAPQGSDGVWPFKAARDFLDRPELDHARDGLTTGLFNKRGMVSKSYAEGGRQERDLAAKYRGEAQALHQSHPLLAAALDILAARYEAHGRSEDIEARLRLEGE